MSVKSFNNGSWELDLGGICYREMYQLGKMLMELGEKGSLYGQDFDIDTLKAVFNSSMGDVVLFDEEGHTTEEEE